jgi:hypothetical protein
MSLCDVAAWITNNKLGDTLLLLCRPIIEHDNGLRDCKQDYLLARRLSRDVCCMDMLEGIYRPIDS